MRRVAHFRKAHFQKRTIRLLGLCLSGATAVLVLAIVLSAPAESQKGAATPVSRPAARVRTAAAIRLPTGNLRTRTINAALQRSFAIFRHRPTGVVAHVVAAPTSQGPTFQGLIPSIVSNWLSRDIAVLGQVSAQNVEVVATDGTQVAVLAGTQGACMAAWNVLPSGGGGYAAGCAPAASVANRGLTFTVHTNSGISRVAGIVPNGNKSVTTTLASGQTEAVPVVSNVFNVTTNGAASIAKVSFATADGGLRTITGGS